MHYFSRRGRKALDADASQASTFTLPEADAPESSQPTEVSVTAETTIEALREDGALEKETKPLKSMTAEQVAQMSLFGHQLFEMGKREEARVVFEGLVSLGVNEAFPYTMLGTIYLSIEDHKRALALFDGALKIDRDDLAALVYRGEILLGKKQYKAARENLERALRLGVQQDPFVERATKLLELLQKRAKKPSR